MRWLSRAALAAIVLTASACTQKPGAPATSSSTSSAGPAAAAAPNAESSKGKLRIAASNSTLEYFIARIAGDAAEVWMPAPDGVDPAFWSPAPGDVSRLQESDLIVLNSAGFEHWRAGVSLPERKVVDTSDAFKKDWIEIKDAVTHSHGLAGAHAHAGTAFTTWIDPMQAVEQAAAVNEALKKARPADAQRFDSAFAALKTDLEDLDRRLEAAVAGHQSRPVLFSHPVYHYLVRRFALNAKAVQWAPGEMPSEDEWTKLSALLKEHPAKWMVWESEPLPATRTKLRELGVECAVFDPAGNLGKRAATWLDVQRENAAALAKVYE